MTYAATLEIVLDSLERPRTDWLIISRTQDTSKEALQECAYHLDRMNLLRRAKMISERTGTLLDGVEQSKFSLILPNGSKIIAMTAHPDAARGFGGNILLDEHAYHRDSSQLWNCAVGSIARGHRILVISTPNYQTGNFYELARRTGLTLGTPPLKNPTRQGRFSVHWVDINMAAPQLAAIGQFIDIDEQRELASSHDAFLQEFCCQFLSAAEMWLPLELIAAAGSPLATANWDPNQPVNGDLYFGADIGRRRDRTAIWIDQSTNGVAICLGLILLDRTPFEQQYEIFCGL